MFFIINDFIYKKIALAFSNELMCQMDYLNLKINFFMLEENQYLGISDCLF